MNLPQLKLSRPARCSRALRMAISETASTTHSKFAWPTLAASASGAGLHVEFDFLLQHHHELASFVISAEKLLGVVQAIDVFPAAACKRFEECRPTDVAENSFPIERIPEITE